MGGARAVAAFSVWLGKCASARAHLFCSQKVSVTVLSYIARQECALGCFCERRAQASLTPRSVEIWENSFECTEKGPQLKSLTSYMPLRLSFQRHICWPEKWFFRWTLTCKGIRPQDWLMGELYDAPSANQINSLPESSDQI